MSDHDLTLALRALGRRLDVEPVADVMPVVLARIAEREPARRRRVRPLVLAFVVLLLLAATAVAASDQLREWLRGSSVEIERVETLPPTVSTPVTTAPGEPTASFAALGLGMPVAANAPAAALGAALPVSAALGPPVAIYRAAPPDADAITLAWAPACPLLLTVVPAHDENDPFLIGKSLTETTSVDYVSLPGGGEGIFLSGAPHAVTLFDGREVQFRLARDVLLWRPDGVRVYRLEGAFDRARALALAGSFR